MVKNIQNLMIYKKQFHQFWPWKNQVVTPYLDYETS
jgi:hypothetical protein